MKQISFKPFITELLINMGIFLVLTFMYAIMMVYPNVQNLRFMWNGIIKVFPSFTVWIIYVVLFYRLFFRYLSEQKNSKSAWRNFLILFVCIFIADQLLIVLPGLFNSGNNGAPLYDATAAETFFFRFILFTAYAVAYSFVRSYLWQRQQKLIAEKERETAALQNLRTQIEPHFIFNTLNNVYALALEENAGKTSATIEELSGLFRYTLKDSNAEKVSIEDELSFIEKYIQLHKIRLQQNENIKLDISIDWDKKPAQIVPLLLISFIENAFKYGISTQNSSYINILLQVKDATLSMDVANSVHQQTAALQNGFGLDNTKKRLQLLYPNRYTLKESYDAKSYITHLQIQLS